MAASPDPASSPVSEEIPELIVAKIAKPQGLRGEVALDIRTDDPVARLAPGQVFSTSPDVGPLTGAASRQANGRWFARFEGIADRTAAEGLRDVEILAPPIDDNSDDAWYPHDLVGLRVELPDGEAVGKVVGVQHGSAQDLLEIREPGAEQDTLIPLVTEIVPVVDVPGGRVVIDPPVGLLARDGENAIDAD